MRLVSTTSKHIFCKKAIGKSPAAIGGLISVVRSAGTKVFIGFQCGFDENFQRLQATSEDGFMVTPLKRHLVARDPYLPQVGYLKQ